MDDYSEPERRGCLTNPILVWYIIGLFYYFVLMPLQSAFKEPAYWLLFIGWLSLMTIPALIVAYFAVAIIREKRNG